MSCQYCKNTTANICSNCFNPLFLNNDNTININKVCFYYRFEILIEVLKKLDNSLGGLISKF